MRVTTTLFWYAEPTEELWAQVTALKGLSDRLVGCYGRWEGFPELDVDHQEQLDTVKKAAEHAGLDCTLHGPSIWPGEVAQRNHTLKLALEDADWVHLMDADERVVSVADNVRDRLERMTVDVGTLEFHTLEGYERPPTTWETPGQTTEQRRFSRAQPDLRFEKHHWWLRTDTQALWGEIRGLEFAVANKLDVRVEHRTCLRTEARRKVKADFRAVRDPADKARGWEY